MNPLTDFYLHANIGSAGGISVVGGGGKIDIDNTLEERLRLLEVDALPRVRVSLFGKNENRRFVD
jgi:V-type H+-transporting ATPase subunit E